MLRQWREENVRKSKDVVQLWEQVLLNKEHKLGDERKLKTNIYIFVYKHSNMWILNDIIFPGYLILEQVCIAAADVNRIDIIDQCLYSLHNEFPGSLRVKRLQVLKLELAEK